MSTDSLLAAAERLEQEINGHLDGYYCCPAPPCVSAGHVEAMQLLRSARDTLSRLRAALGQSQEALKAAAPHVCSMLCESAKFGDRPWKHSAECQAITAALLASPPLASPQE